MSQKLTISEMQVLARTHGGKCLSSTYAGAHSKLKWQCVKGHKWEARPSDVKAMGTWCAKCSGTKPMATIEEMQALAGRYRGKCLSKVYRGSSKKLRWRCAKGHEWESAPSIVKNGGHWCRECSGSKGTIEAMQALAKKHKGECLSSTYVGLKNKHRWRCAKGHEWETTPNSIKYMGTWCPKCSGKTVLGTIEAMQALAKKHGGECLSLTYVGSLKKLHWRCAKGHEWESTPTNVKNGGYWCRECRKVRKRMKDKGGRMNFTTAKQKK